MKIPLRSEQSTVGRRMAGARALWVANGMKREQMGRPIIAIANSFTQFVPGHTHLHEIGQIVKAEIEKMGCFLSRGGLWSRTSIDIFMRKRLTIIILFSIVFATGYANSLVDSVRLQVSSHDTFYLARMHDIYVYPKMVFKSKRDRKSVV